MKFEPHILAEVHLLPTAQGGRRGVTPTEVFGCPLGYAGEFFDVRFDLSGIGALSPGSTTRVPIHFLCPHLIVPRLSVGSRFTLWEGGTIGEGTVSEISPSPA